MSDLPAGVAHSLSVYLSTDSGHADSERGARAARAKRKRGGSAAASEAREAAGTVALDSTLSYECGHDSKAESGADSPDSVGERRAIRWGARALLWQASTLRPVRQCGRVLRDDPGAPSTGAGVKRRELSHATVAGYSGVTLCGSVWACPRCSAVVAQRRAEEIGRAVAECHARGGSVYLLTLTVRHRRGDALADLFEAISRGWRAAFTGAPWTGRKEQVRTRSGRTWIEPALPGDAEIFGVAGRVRSTEATVSLPGSGGHGWHLHFHALLFVESDLGVGIRTDLSEFLEPLFGRVAWDRAAIGRIAFGSRIFGRYQRAVERAGFAADVEGFDIRLVHDGGAEFVGSYLSKSTYDVAAKLGMEVASGAHTKNSRSERNVTPFEVLARCAEDLQARRFGIRTTRHWEVLELDDSLGLVDLDTGEITAFTSPGLWSLWHEWERASRGRRQVVWSRPLKDDGPRAALWDAIILARGETEDDEEVARTELLGAWLGEIPREAWYGSLVWRPRWLVGALEAAEAGGQSGVEAYLSARGVAFEARGGED